MSPTIQKIFLKRTFIKGRLVLSLIIVIGAILRIFDLGSKSFRGDELRTIWHARDITNIKTFLFSTWGDAHPPLYFLFLKLWSYFGDGEFYLRLLSVIFGIFVIPATYLLGRQFFEKRACLLAAFLVAISPFLLTFDRELRVYPQFVFFTIISIFFYINALKENKNGYWFGYTIFTILNSYTHYHAFLVIASMWLFFFLRFRTYKSLWKRALFSQIAIAFCFCFLLPAFLFHLKIFSVLGGEPTRFPTVFGFWIKPLYLFFSYSLGQTILPWNFLIVVPGVVVFSFFFFWGFKTMFKSKETLVFFLVFLLFPILLALLISDVMPRYLVFLSPIFCIVIGQGISDTSSDKLRMIAVLLVTILLGFSLRNYYLNREFHILAFVDPSREVACYINDNFHAGDLVVNVGGSSPIKYYLSKQISNFHTILTELDKIENDCSANRIWLIISNTKLKKQGDEAIKWMNEHYHLISEKRYYRDPNYAKKRKLFKKDFLEYRIKVYLYESRN